MSEKFKISMPLTKAYERTEKSEGVETTKYYVGGLASGTNIDLEGERMAESAVIAFRRAIHEGMFLPDGRWSMIPLRSGHRTEWDDILGWIVDCSVDEQWNFFIEAELDGNSPTAMSLYKKLTSPQVHGRPLELGLSVGGYVVSAGEEWNDVTQEYAKVYYDVALREVSVVSKPANPMAYVHALAKSVDWSRVQGHKTILMTEEQLMEDLTKNENVVTEDVTKADATEGVEIENTETEVEKDTEVTEPAVEAVEKTEATEEVEDVTKDAEVQVSEVTEEVSKGTTDPLDAFASQISDLVKAVADLVADVQELKGAQVEKSVEVEEQVEKTQASTETTEPPVSQSVDVEAIVKAAVEPLMSALVMLKGQIDEIATQPVDKSLAVSEANKKPADPMAIAKSEADATRSPQQAFGAYFKQAIAAS